VIFVCNGILIVRVYAYFQKRFCRLAAEKIYFTNSDTITRIVCVCVCVCKSVLHILIAMIDPMEVGCVSMEWNGVVQDRGRLRELVNAVMNFWVL
jgi:hypothetical protein